MYSSTKPSPKSDVQLRKELEYFAEAAEALRLSLQLKDEGRQYYSKQFGNVTPPKEFGQLIKVNPRMEELVGKLEKAVRDAGRAGDLRERVVYLHLLMDEIEMEREKEPDPRSLRRRFMLKIAGVMGVIFHVVYVGARGAYRGMRPPNREPLTPESATRGEA